MDGVGPMRRLGWLVAPVLIYGCAVMNPTEEIKANCIASSGGSRDNSSYWKCINQNMTPVVEKRDPLNSALMQLYFRAQTGIWMKYEGGKTSLDDAQTASLQLKDSLVQELVRRRAAMSEIDARQSQAFMQRMQGLAALNDATGGKTETIYLRQGN